MPQPLLDGPRAGLTETFVRSLLQSHSAIRITYGADALGPDFGVKASVPLSGGSIISNVTAKIQRTCTLNMDNDVVNSGWSYLSGFIRPYMTITEEATGDSATFHLGVYTLTTPSMNFNQSGLTFTGYDLNYFLTLNMGDSYEVAAGVDPAQAAADLIGLALPGAEVQVTPSGSTLPKQMSWPLDPANPTTYLAAIMELLDSIGYREVWVDWDGRFRIEPFVDLQTVEASWPFDVQAQDAIVSPARTQNVDIFSVPNWFRFVMADLTDTPVEGVSQFTWEDSSADNPASLANRLHTVRYVESVTATSYDDLVAYAQKKIVSLLSPSETFTVTSQPFPIAWHMDVYLYLDTALGGGLPLAPANQRRVLATDWTLPLDGSDMSWTWQTVNEQTAALGLSSTTTG